MSELNGHTPPVTIEVPQYMVEATDLGGTIMLSLVITTTGTRSQFFLCTADQNYQQIAKQIHDGICQAGAEARRQMKPATRLVMPKGVNSDALRVEKQGEEQRGPRRPRT